MSFDDTDPHLLARSGRSDGGVVDSEMDLGSVDALTAPTPDRRRYPSPLTPAHHTAMRATGVPVALIAVQIRPELPGLVDRLGVVLSTTLGLAGET